MESSHLVIFCTSGKFITKFNVLLCISLSETLFWTGARGRIPITLMCSPVAEWLTTHLGLIPNPVAAEITTSDRHLPNSPLDSRLGFTILSMCKA